VRSQVAFGLQAASWNEELVLERYELLYQAGLVAEAARDQSQARPGGGETGTGVAMAVDHRRILATAVGRLRGKIKYRPVVFELMPPAFTLSQLQQTVEALSGVRLHKQNFRRLVEQQGLVEETGEISAATGGRPAPRARAAAARRQTHGGRRGGVKIRRGPKISSGPPAFDLLLIPIVLRDAVRRSNRSGNHRGCRPPCESVAVICLLAANVVTGQMTGVVGSRGGDPAGDARIATFPIGRIETIKIRDTARALIESFAFCRIVRIGRAVQIDNISFVLKPHVGNRYQQRQHDELHCHSPHKLFDPETPNVRYRTKFQFY
jgi:hypothetical protein